MDGEFFGDLEECIQQLMLYGLQVCQDFYGSQTCNFTLITSRAPLSLETTFAWSTPSVVAHSHCCANYFEDIRASS